mgnify:CR=1 FL=1
MGGKKKVYYIEEVELTKKRYYESLSEKAQRHFLGQEYLTLGLGSQRYLSRVFNCSRHRIKRGVEELRTNDLILSSNGQRKSGGGRKKKKI